ERSRRLLPFVLCLIRQRQQQRRLAPSRSKCHRLTKLIDRLRRQAAIEIRSPQRDTHIRASARGRKRCPKAAKRIVPLLESGSHLGYGRANARALVAARTRKPFGQTAKGSHERSLGLAGPRRSGASLAKNFRVGYLDRESRVPDPESRVPSPRLRINVLPRRRRGGDADDKREQNNVLCEGARVRGCDGPVRGRDGTLAPSDWTL